MDNSVIKKPNNIKTPLSVQELWEKLRREKMKKLSDSLKADDRVKIGSVGNGL